MVYGSTNATWRYSNDERFALVADKTSYVVGDTAQVLVPAPYPGAIGLVTIERGKNIRQTVMRFDTNTAVISVRMSPGSGRSDFNALPRARWSPTRVHRSTRFAVLSHRSWRCCRRRCP
ncbi:MAG: hypothetical protein WC273_10535 [Dehalococcoidia bacterium]